MTPTLVRQHLPRAGRAPRVDPCARARDWSEIQERMLVPLYEAVYERLEVGPGSRLLGLGCGSGLALLMAASRGAAVTGVDASAPERLALARQRLLPANGDAGARSGTRLVDALGDAREPGSSAFTVVTAFEPIGCLAGDAEGLAGLLAAATPLAGRGAPVVLAGSPSTGRRSTSAARPSGAPAPAAPGRCPARVPP
ncbi:SAM-dependent methyltransferase, partial [Streptomyces nigra]